MELFQDANFADDFIHSKSTPGGMFCIVADQTFCGCLLGHPKSKTLSLKAAEKHKSSLWTQASGWKSCLILFCRIRLLFSWNLFVITHMAAQLHAFQTTKTHFDARRFSNPLMVFRPTRFFLTRDRVCLFLKISKR